MATKYAILSTAMNWSASTWGQSVAGGVWNQGAQTLTPATPTWAPGTDLTGLKVQVNTTLYTVASNTDTVITMTVSGVLANGTYAWVLFNEVKPTTGDTVYLNNGTVTLDDAATASLVQITDNALGSGVLVVSLAAQSKTINGNIVPAAPGSGGFIQVSGAGAGCNLTINGNVQGGSGGTLGYGINFNSTNVLTINGNVQGGSSSNAHGIRLQAAGTVNISNGYNVQGGTGSGARGIWNITTGTINVLGGNVLGGVGVNTSAHGIYNNTGTVNVVGSVFGGQGIITAQSFGIYLVGTAGSLTVTNGNITGGLIKGAFGIYSDIAGNFATTVTFNNVNLINGTTLAYVGPIPTWTPSATNYESWGATQLAVQLAAGLVALDTPHGTITGTRIDCPVAKALTTSGNYGDPSSPLVGIYAPPAVGGGDWM